MSAITQSVSGGTSKYCQALTRVSTISVTSHMKPPYTGRIPNWFGHDDKLLPGVDTHMCIGNRRWEFGGRCTGGTNPSIHPGEV